MDKLFYGVAYYREYMPYERLEKDIEMMKKANINVVRIAESTWSTFEKQEGEFDFSSVTTVLDAMYKNGISVIVGTPTYAFPAWLAKKYPDVLADTPNGKSKYGHRQNMDITHPTYRYYARGIIERLIKAVADHPAVIGYQVDNETKYYDTCSEAVQIGFRKYLKKQFNGDLNKLNHAFGLDYWSNRIDSWEDFPDATSTINASLATAFEKYQRKLVTDYIAWQVKLVKQFKKDNQFITHNFDFEWRNYSYGVQPAVDHYQTSQPLDIAGVDIYHPGQDFLTGKEISFGGDITRCLKDNNYFVLETEAQAFKNWTPYKGQLTLQAFAHVATGAGMVAYWHWHSIHNSYETYWKGLLSHDMLENPVYNEACEIGAKFKELSPELVNLKKKNKVCVVVSNEALSAIDWQPYHGHQFERNKEHQYNDIFRRYYDALYEMNIECDVKNIESDDIFNYDVLVLPLLYTVSDEKLAKFVTYVKNGGHILVSFKTAFTDENLKVRQVLQPGLLNEVTGSSYQLFAEPNNLNLVSEVLDLENVDTNIEDWIELLTLNDDKTVVLGKSTNKYYQDYATITYRQNDKGSATYIGANVSEGVIKKVVEYIDNTNALGLKVTNNTFPIVYRNAISQNNEKLTFVFNYSQEDKTVFDENLSGVDIFSGEAVDGKAGFTMKDYGVRIIKHS